MQVVLSGFSMSLFCSGKKLYVGMVAYIYWLPRVYVRGCDGDVIYVGHDLNRCTGVVVSLCVNVKTSG